MSALALRVIETVREEFVYRVDLDDFKNAWGDELDDWIKSGYDLENEDDLREIIIEICYENGAEIDGLTYLDRNQQPERTYEIA